MTTRPFYIGTYTSDGSEGIYYGRFHVETGEMSGIRPVASLENPSFLAIHPSGRWLYAVSEVDETEAFGPGGAVHAYRIHERTGDLTFINAQSTQGTSPCYVSIGMDGRTLLAANYGSGSVVSYPIEEDGTIGSPASFYEHRGQSVHPTRQKAPHAHSILPDPRSDRVYVADLGVDRLFIYRLDVADQGLKETDVSGVPTRAGAGPRHMAFHPHMPVLYVANELDSTVTAFSVHDDDGSLTVLDTHPTLPAQFQGESTVAHIQVHPAGHTLYVSNRGHDSIAVFAVDEETGKLRLRGHAATLGKTPRHFTLDPEGRFLLAANQNSDHIAAFSVNPSSGLLQATGCHALVSKPVCIVF